MHVNFVSKIHVSLSHVTLWCSAISLNLIGIKYMRNMSLIVALPYLSHTKSKTTFYSDSSMSWYNSLIGICDNIFCKNFVWCRSFTNFNHLILIWWINYTLMTENPILGYILYQESLLTIIYFEILYTTEANFIFF